MRSGGARAALGVAVLAAAVAIAAAAPAELRAPAASALEQPAPSRSALKQPAPSRSALKQPAPSRSALKQPAPSRSALKQPAPSRSALKQPAPSRSALKQPAPSRSALKLRQIARFDQPTYVTQAPGEPHTLYVVEQRGKVIAVRKGRKLGRPFLNLTERVRFGPGESSSEEAGMFSIAFDPHYPDNGRFYVFYTGPGGNNFVDQYRRSGSKSVRAARESRRSVLEIRHPWADSHNGGQLQFGPDGNLWISSGDGGCCDDIRDQARTLGTMLGKLLRVDPRPDRRGFSAPPDNPLLGRRGDDAVYAWGLRNAWRFSFDRLTGNLVIPDVGDNHQAREEINYLSLGAAAGVNFGWPEYEGFLREDPGRPGQGRLVMPIAQYRHTGGRCAITGGYVVRDPALPQLWGRYLYADFCGGRIRSLALPELVDGFAPATRVTDDRDEGVYQRYLSSFGEGLGGQIYVTSLAGPVYRLQARRR